MDSDPVGDQLAQVLSGIRNDIPGSEERLSAILRRGMRLFLARGLGNSGGIDRGVDDCLMAVVSAIRDRALREPAGVVRLALTVVRQYAAEANVGMGHVGHSTFAETDAEKVAILSAALSALPASDHELLRRFYSQGETEDQIRQAMGLNKTQFHLKKSRAMAKVLDSFRNGVRRS